MWTAIEIATFAWSILMAGSTLAAFRPGERGEVLSTGIMLALALSACILAARDLFGVGR